MYKCLIVSDSFKGTLTSSEVGRIIKKELQHYKINCDYIPLSDGGDGFIDCISYLEQIPPLEIETTGALGKPGVGKYIFNPHTKELFLELAEACGINKIKKSELDVLNASTFGFGQMIRNTIEKHHPERVYLGLGGSASVDLGAGILEGIGVSFFDGSNKKISRLSNGKIGMIKRINNRIPDYIRNTNFFVINDANIKIFSDDGAIKKYSVQKGANDNNIDLVYQNAKHFYQLVNQLDNNQTDDFIGAGAAGGSSFSLVHFLNAKVLNGIDFILKKLDLLNILTDYDLMITGEGKLDSQTLQGKLVSGIVKANEDVIILCGSKEEQITYKNVFTITPNICSLDESINNPKKCLIKLINSINWIEFIKEK